MRSGGRGKGGARSACTYYDSSEGNPLDPSYFPKPVTRSEQTTDEMCLWCLGFTVDAEHAAQGKGKVATTSGRSSSGPAEKVAFYLVYPDPDTTLAAARQHAKDYGYTCPLLLDPAHRLAHRAGATVTPEAAVFAPGGRLLYRGRIDDLFFGYGRQRAAVTRHDLRDALDAALAGRPVAAPQTPPIGCFI